jgi:hypothetical protein
MSLLQRFSADSFEFVPATRVLIDRRAPLQNDTGRTDAASQTTSQTATQTATAQAQADAAPLPPPRQRC